jgi:hypothetical protein
MSCLRRYIAAWSNPDEGPNPLFGPSELLKLVYHIRNFRGVRSLIRELYTVKAHMLWNSIYVLKVRGPAAWWFEKFPLRTLYVLALLKRRGYPLANEKTNPEEPEELNPSLLATKQHANALSCPMVEMWSVGGKQTHTWIGSLISIQSPLFHRLLINVRARPFLPLTPTAYDSRTQSDKPHIK